MEYSSFEKILKHLSTFCWECNIDDETIFNIAKKHYLEMPKDYTKNFTFVRTAGQSGSGKTTQLLPCAEKYFENKNMKPLSLAVRKFATLHPDYDQIVQKFGASEMRERTNLLALKCLLIILIFAISDGYDVLLEVTWLTPEFEDFINKNLDKNNYKKINLLLAVNKEISNYLIERRKSVAGKESGRVVYKSSTDFFYDNLENSLKYYAKNYPTENVIMWDAYSADPVYVGEFAGSLKPFLEARKNISYNFVSEEMLRNAKINFLLNFN